MNELEKVAQEEERRLEAFEKKKMGGEDAQSRNRQAWDRIFQSVPNPFPKVPVTGDIDNLFDVDGLDDQTKGNDKGKAEGEEKGKNVKRVLGGRGRR